MKRTKEFIKRNIAGEIVLVPSGQTAREFNGMVTLTETGEFIWEHIEEAESFNHLVLLILEEYEVDKDTASQDHAEFLYITCIDGIGYTEVQFRYDKQYNKKC